MERQSKNLEENKHLGEEISIVSTLRVEKPKKVKVRK